MEENALKLRKTHLSCRKPPENARNPAQNPENLTFNAEKRPNAHREPICNHGREGARCALILRLPRRRICHKLC